MIRLCRSKGQTGEDILPLKMRKIAQQFGFANTSGKKIEDVLRPDTMPRMQGRPPHWFGLKVMRSMTQSLTLTQKAIKAARRPSGVRLPPAGSDHPNPLCALPGGGPQQAEDDEAAMVRAFLRSGSSIH